MFRRKVFVIVCAMLLASCALASFQVEANGTHVWGSPVKIAGSLYTVSSYSDPPVTAISNGHAVAAWTQPSDPGSNDNINSVYASVSTGGVWSDAVMISSGAADASNPAAGIDGNGNAMVVWQQANPDTGNTSIFVSMYTNGAWSAPKVISDPSINAEGPLFAMNSGGFAIVAWDEMNSAIQCESLYARTYSDGTWTAKTLVSSATAPHGAVDAQMAMNEYGQAIIVWEQVNSVTYSFDVFANVYEDGQWATVKKVASDTKDSFLPCAAMDSDGDAKVAWFYGTVSLSSIYSVYAIDYTDGSWGTKELLGTDAYYETSSLSLTMDENGGALALWLVHNSTSGSKMIAACLCQDGAWEPEKVISTGTTDADYVHGALDDSGNATVVWAQMDPDTSVYRIYACTYAEGTWGASQIISITTDDLGATWPEIAVDHNGDAVVVWPEWGTEEDMDNGSICAAFLDSGNSFVTYARSLTGSVMDIDGKAIAGATVKLADSTATTDADGNFAFQNTTVGSHTLTVQKDGYSKVTTSVTVKAKKTTDIGNLTMTVSGSGTTTSSRSDSTILIIVAVIAIAAVAVVTLVMIKRKRRS